jgi:hypothetical protein
VTGWECGARRVQKHTLLKTSAHTINHTHTLCHCCRQRRVRVDSLEKKALARTTPGLQTLLDDGADLAQINEELQLHVPRFYVLRFASARFSFRAFTLLQPTPLGPSLSYSLRLSGLYSLTIHSSRTFTLSQSTPLGPSLSYNPLLLCDVIASTRQLEQIATYESLLADTRVELESYRDQVGSHY